MTPIVTVLGIYAADLAFRAPRLPAMGETLIGGGFQLGPGGKGSNQAVAARRAGAEVRFITRLGADEFGEQARRTYAAEGIALDHIYESPDLPTGAAFIFLHETSGENAIIVVPGAAGALSEADVTTAEPAIAGSRVFITQLETPLAVGRWGLEIARRHGVLTILNPAPAAPLPNDLYPLVDVFTPNESEAAALVGHPVDSLEQAEAAASRFLEWGVGTVALTLGARGVLFKDRSDALLIPAEAPGQVVDTTGAGDAFNGALAVALAEGMVPVEAVRFGCVAAGLSVTRPGTAPSMARRDEIEALLNRI